MARAIVVSVNPEHPEPALIHTAAEMVRTGGLVAFPTETVYGLGANALDATAVERIFQAKGRPASDPLIVHLAGYQHLDTVASEIPPLAGILAHHFWPGPLTLVLHKKPLVPANVSAGRATVAVRVPHHPVALALLEAVGLPIAAPSANRFSRPSPTSAQHVLDDLDGRVDMVLDGGTTRIGLESTVVDLTRDPPVLLRPGGVPIEALREFIPAIELRPAYLEPGAEAASPGMLLKHYSPDAELIVFDGAREAALLRMRGMAAELAGQGRIVGLLIPNEDAEAFAGLPVRIAYLGPAGDLSRIGAALFAQMRELEPHVDLILVRGFAREGLGLAIWDRLLRAAQGHVLEC